jgi:hypothetical protein
VDRPAGAGSVGGLGDGGWIGWQRALIHRHDLEEAGHRWAQAVGIADYRPVGDGPQAVVVGAAAPVALTIGWALLFVVFLFVS